MTEHTDSTAPTDDQDAPDALAAHATRLGTTDPTDPLDDLEPLRDRFADARIVGLGEATHGTREFFRLKHRFLEFLVTELGTRVLAMEANLPETRALDEYVAFGRGDPVDALDDVYFWTWKTEEVLALVEWLRDFNDGRPLDDRVRFYGFDAQYTAGAIDALRDYFEAVDPEFLDACDLDVLDDESEPPHQDDGLDALVAAADDVFPRVEARLTDNGDEYVADTSERAWGCARRTVRIAEQAVEYKRAMRDWRAADDGTAAADEAITRVLRVRDRAMAENVAWIREFEDAERVALWGHDAHLNRETHALRDSSVSAPSMGAHLAAEYGDDYFALGFAFGRGSFQAMGSRDGEFALREWTVEGAPAGTLDAVLADLGDDAFVLDVRGASEDDALREWLETPRTHRSIGATYDGTAAADDYLTAYAYADAFDAVCYVDETTRARPLEQ